MKVERLRSSKAVGDYMEAFERKRTQDLKVYTHNTMYSNCYVCVQMYMYMVISILFLNMYYICTKLLLYTSVWVPELTHTCSQ